MGELVGTIVEERRHEITITKRRSLPAAKHREKEIQRAADGGGRAAEGAVEAAEGAVEERRF
jgi:hypothetical protein